MSENHGPRAIVERADLLAKLHRIAGEEIESYDEFLFKQLEPWLRNRKQVAEYILDGRYEHDEEKVKSGYEVINYCNEQIKLILSL